MVMSRSNFPSLLVEGLREVYFNWLDMKSLVYPEVYEIRTSKKQKETDRTIAGIDMLSAKAEGEAIDYDDFVEGYEVNYTHTTYAKGLRATEELLEDQLYGVLGQRAKVLGNATRYRMEYDHASLFNNASGTTIFSGPNSEALLYDSHALAATPGTTFDNLATSSLTVSALQTAITNFRKMVDDRNMRVAIEPAVLLIPPDLEFKAYEILNSTGKPYTADYTSVSLPYASVN